MLRSGTGWRESGASASQTSGSQVCLTIVWLVAGSYAHLLLKLDDETFNI